ncbi:2-amino-4-hydroxy-6-hydroxymethyldihydropteridine diphosphokinase [Prevotella sp. HUN102]|uniref:2-amino-4-hydroxy-6- hydroxymethyldihydropteridine diphosphokinase n=1 Tax=Prevotella sp. HUN102 TaxID=1392486 RepID=UPI00048C14DA|nr:2-amino-4-hydroxy-6-hydroxymethyldihydropteridine diphosphokinase [Prevotella sp. HUN102]
MRTAYLGLGSNLGNRRAILTETIAKINESIGAVLRQSSFYETEPWGFDSPNTFLNACICITTDLEPLQLLAATQRIEREMGRNHKTIDGQYQDRIIDIDILLIDNLRINEPHLTVPHPLMEQREFVMVPLKEILLKA